MYLHNSLARVGIHKPCRAVIEGGRVSQKVHIIEKNDAMGELKKPKNQSTWFMEAA